MKKTIIAFFMLIVLIITENLLLGKDNFQQTNNWQSPPEEILKVLNAPELPRVWTSPTGEYLFLSDPELYPPLSQLAAPMHKLAGMRVDPDNNGYHGWNGNKNPRLLKISDGSVMPLKLPENEEVYRALWSADGKRFALMVNAQTKIKLYVGSVNGDFKEIKDVALNPLLGSSIQWTPDQQQLLIYRIPERGDAPIAPAIPKGPEILEGDGAGARSTYEARNLLETAYDDALFSYYTKSELVILDPENEELTILGKPDQYTEAKFSPDGNFLLIERLVGPWSHEVAWWRFAHEVEVWDKEGKFVKTIASLPLADAVPTHGVPTGPRNFDWRPTAPHQLFYLEALDGGNPVVKAEFRDKIMLLDDSFNKAKEVFKAHHRIWRSEWGAKDGLLLISEYERMKRWSYTWLLDVDKGNSKLWYDLNVADRYNDPGRPLTKQLANGFWVMQQKDDEIYFKGRGATPEGARPFLDLRSITTGKTKRLFRCSKDKYEFFVDFAKDNKHFIYRSESAKEVPNYYLGTFEKEIQAVEGEALFTYRKKPLTNFKDPAPELRKITKKIVHYEREDGVPLSFQLYLPPDYQEGTKLPTVINAYPLEYSSAAMAGQVSGSDNRFMRLWAASPLYFLLQGYAVLDDTAMPMIGDPETTYDTFVPQLVADAKAAIKKAVELGVTDPERVGIIGHSHGALMVANLLAHTDLFKAGIARSGSYNKTNQPFGFQAERRSLFKARETYINVSPTFFADKVNEPILIIHGKADSNPGTLTAQSEVFYEAVRGSGGTARLVLLPFEDHGYRAKESIKHVLWEQLNWFNKYLKSDYKNKDFSNK